MVLLSASHVSKAFGTEVILENVSFNVEEGDKIGILGMNGAGKSTLFKIVTGDLDCDEGEIFKARQLKISYMEQFAKAESEQSAYDEVLFGAFSETIEIENALNELQKQMEHSADKDLIEKYDRMHNLFIEKEGLVYKNLTMSALVGLGLTQEEIRLPMTALSGGQRTRVMLAKMLLEKADILLLDEPTNHLDIAAISWLENFLAAYKGTVMLITHDRYFLDRTTNRIFDISHHKLREYRGNYSKYRQEKELYEASVAKEYALKTKEIARLEGIITQQKQWNRERNIKTAESKQKVIDRIKEGLITPEEAEKSIRFKFNIREGCGNDVLTVTDLAKSFDGGAPLFQNVNLEIKKGEKVFLLGANGCGKTTLFHLLTGRMKADKGQIRRGSRVDIAYYDQHQSDLDPEKTIFDEVSDALPTLDNTTIRCALAAFLFTGEDVFKQISTLSGGERARVCLTKLMLSKANFLLLDEPTNHLDIPSKEALEKALLGYDGTLFIISHDRYFINCLADRIVCLTPNGMENYGGNYAYYLDKISEKKEKTEKKETSASEEYRKNKEAESAKRKMKTKVSRLEQKIAELEEKGKELQTLLQDPQTVDDYVKLTELTNTLNENDRALEQAMADWEESVQALEEMS